jgi:hypothetical protein
VIRAIFQVRSCVTYKYRDRDLCKRTKAGSRLANFIYIRRIPKVSLAEGDYVIVNSVGNNSVSVVVGVVVVVVVTVLKGIVCEVFFKKKEGFKLVLKLFFYKYV